MVKDLLILHCWSTGGTIYTPIYSAYVDENGEYDGQPTSYFIPRIHEALAPTVGGDLMAGIHGYYAGLITRTNEALKIIESSYRLAPL